MLVRKCIQFAVAFSAECDQDLLEPDSSVTARKTMKKKQITVSSEFQDQLKNLMDTVRSMAPFKRRAASLAAQDDCSVKIKKCKVKDFSVQDQLNLVFKFE